MTGNASDDWERIESPLRRLEELLGEHPPSPKLRDTVSELRGELQRLQSDWNTLERAALEDPLTGIGNRRAFEMELRRAFSGAVRYRQPLSLILIDVDRFKQINDRYGHIAGDQVLRRIGRIMHDLMRSADFVARYGGDEFVAILPSTDATGAEHLGQRLRHELNQPLLWMLADSSEVVIDVSAGVGTATLQESDKSEWDLFRRCDEALIRAKHGVKQG